MNLVQKSISIAVLAHAGQYRKGIIGGFRVPYIIHPFDVMKMAHRLGFGDEITLSCCILHDAVEDNKDKPEVLDAIKALGVPEIVHTVMDLSFLSGSKEEYMARFALPSMNYRSIVVKAFDRMCNVKDLFINGEKDYARKYMKKADSVYMGLICNQQKIINEWDIYAYRNLMSEWTSL